MKFKEWNEIAELVGIVAVVVSLVLLIVELRGNTEALRAQTINAAYQAESQRRHLVITNDGGIADLVLKGRNGEDLTQAELWRLHRYYTHLLDTFEYQFGEVQAGRLPMELLNVSNWRGMSRSQPLLQERFEQSKTNRNSKFVQYWEEQVMDR